MQVGGKCGVVSDMNVVPLNDILLVLLVIFMIIPARQVGLEALIPHASQDPKIAPSPEEIVVVQVLEDGTLRINQEPVNWDRLGSRLEDVFKLRASRVAFVRADSPVEFGVVAKVIDTMHGAGIASVGLLTAELEKGL